MTTLTNPTAPTATHGRTYPTMTTPTGAETISPDEVRAVPVKAVPLLHCPIWGQAAENLVESCAGIRLHPLDNATGSRDAP
jgi:hypothetical protein